MVQWLRLCAPNAGGLGLIPGWETKIPHTATKPMHSRAHAPQLEKHTCSNEDPVQPKQNKTKPIKNRLARLKGM